VLKQNLILDMTLARKFLRKQSKKRRNQPLPDNYPQTLRQQPDNLVFYMLKQQP